MAGTRLAYGKLLIVDHAILSIPPGSLSLTLIGASGSGKPTIACACARAAAGEAPDD